MIRDKFFRDITNTIDNHQRFESYDFKVASEKNSNSITTLTIKYLIEPKYIIVFKIPSSTTTEKESYSPFYAFSGAVCPGPLSYEESFSFKGEDGVFHRIKTWLDCIWEELSANPIVKIVESQQEQIDEIYAKFETVKDEYFSDEEAKDLRNKLDELEEKLKQQINQSTENKKELEMKVSKLHGDIDTLKQTINSFKKKGWLRSFTSKVFKWSKDSENRKLLKDGYSVIRNFLPEEVKSSFPE